MAIQTKEFWGVLTGTASELTSMRSVQEILLDNMVYGGTKQKLESDLSGTSGVVLAALLGINTVAVAAATFFGVVNSLEASAKSNNALIMTRGKYVLSELIAIVKSNSDYRKIEATVFFREYYNTVTGARIRVVYGNSVPGDSQNNQQTGAFKINRIQLANGSWLES